MAIHDPNARELSPEEVKFFDDNGYVGPFKLFESEEMADIWADIRLQLLNISNTPFPDSKLNYDRHLDRPEVNKLITHPALVSRLQGLLGPNLLCWRTAWFPKYPGSEGTDWHQAQGFVEFEGQPKLVPVEKHSGPWELTAWLAMTDSTKANGCMKVMPGTHNKWFYDENRNIDFHPESINKKEIDGRKSGVYGYNYDELKLDPDWKPDESKARLMEMKAGEFFIFTSRCLHGSEPNMSSDDVRCGLAMRFVPTDVRVYPDRDSFQAFGETLSLDNYATVLVSGTDTYRHNKIRKPLSE